MKWSDFYSLVKTSLRNNKTLSKIEELYKLHAFVLFRIILYQAVYTMYKSIWMKYA